VVGPRSAGSDLVRAPVIDLLKPKSILFFVAFLPQFVAPGLGHLGGQFLVLGATFVLIDLLVDGPVGLVSGRFAQTLRRSHRIARGLSVFSGFAFAGLAVRMAVSD